VHPFDSLHEFARLVFLLFIVDEPAQLDNTAVGHHPDLRKLIHGVAGQSILGLRVHDAVVELATG
jgi:hypothetical protein